ncbi:hypothetical protein V8F20_011209 [Naviculisporaceae sp. PSN 640]
MTRETLTCLKITARDQQQLQAFRSCLDGIRQEYEKREMEQGWFKAALNQGKVTAVGGSPSASRRTSSLSFLPGVDRSAAFPATPSIQELFGDPVTATTRHELSPEYLARLENYASSSPPIGPTETGFERMSPPTIASPRTPTHRPPTRPVTRSFSIRRSDSNATRPEEIRGRRAVAPSFISTPPSESSSSRTLAMDNTSEVFADLDSNIRRFMSSTFGLGSADETIRTLHSLPGGPRALLYEIGSAASSAEGDLGTQHRRFRCPFDIVYPQNGLNTACQGPGFYPLERLWKHLEKNHSSFDCHNCLRDFQDYDGIEAHMLQGCRDPSTNLPSRIPFALLLRVERTLLQQGSTSAAMGLGILAEEDEVTHRQEIERWNRMWDVLFPSLGRDPTRRPSPFLEAPSISHDSNLARLEMIFAAMVESDAAGTGSASSGGIQDGTGMISKISAKRYLRAAIQALLGEQLSSWEKVLTRVELEVDGPGSVSSVGNNRVNRGGNAVGPFAGDFLSLMAASKAEAG